ncbi:MAG: hypothetical protein GY754_24330 [bacterium]|nr:hypothetical protein [bacterium]
MSSCGYERDNARDPFNFSANDDDPAPEPLNASLSVFVSEDTVAAGETVTVTGEVNGGGPSTQYSYHFRVKAPDGDSFQLLESRWDANTSSYSWAAGSDPGTYTIKVEAENSDNTWNSSMTGSFTVQSNDTKTTSSISVDIEPQEAVDAGALWKATVFDRYSNEFIAASGWQEDGDTFDLDRLIPDSGSYLVELKCNSVEGYQIPTRRGFYTPLWNGLLDSDMLYENLP